MYLTYVALIEIVEMVTETRMRYIATETWVFD